MTLSRTALVVIAVLGGLALSTNLHAQADGDVAHQIKELQQQSRDAQMKNDASWAQQHLADGFVAGIAGAIGKRRRISLKTCRIKPTNGNPAT